MYTNVEAAARRVASARQGQAEADSAVAAANTALAAVQTLVGRLNVERAALIDAARQGCTDADAALRVGVIDADLADAAPLLADARAGVKRAEADAAEAFQATAAAERDLAIERDRETEAMLVERAEALSAMLATAIAELKEIQHRRGGRPAWAPQTGLVRELTSLRLVADRRMSDGVAGRRSAA
jgi:hypothetical protein